MLDRTITIVLCEVLPVETITTVSGFLQHRPSYGKRVNSNSIATYV